MCIKCIKWDSRLGWVENWLSLPVLTLKWKGILLSCCHKDTKVSWQLIKMIKHQLTERSQYTNMHKETWSSAGIFSAFSLNRLHDPCHDLCSWGCWEDKEKRWLLVAGLQCPARMQLAASSLTLQAWQQGTGSSAFLPPCKWWHSCIHMFNETITLWALSSKESFEKWEFVIL